MEHKRHVSTGKYSVERYSEHYNGNKWTIDESDDCIFKHTFDTVDEEYVSRLINERNPLSSREYHRWNNSSGNGVVYSYAPYDPYYRHVWKFKRI